jgi:hypothetical protein
MKLATLLIIVGVVIFLYLIFRGYNKENLTPSPYKISWQAPSNNGGDPKCCSYDWQVCNLSDTGCLNPVDSGTTSNLSVETTKLNWATTYNIRVRASNVSGKGDWATVQLSTGDGEIDSIVFGESINSDGTVTMPLYSGTGINVVVWTSMKTGSVSPNTLKGTATVTATRGDAQLFSHSIPLVSATSGDLDTFMGDFSSNKIPLVVFQKGDLVSADIYIVDAKGNVVTEALSTTSPITNGPPGAISGIKLTYSATPPPLPLAGRARRWLNDLYTTNSNGYKTVYEVASAANSVYNGLPQPNTSDEYQAKMSIQFLTRLSWVGNSGNDSIFRGIGYFYVFLYSMGWDNGSICAALNLYRRVPADSNLAKTFNLGAGISGEAPDSPAYTWSAPGVPSQNYYNQIQEVLATKPTFFATGLSFSVSPKSVCQFPIEDCVGCKTVVDAPMNTDICSGTGNISECAATSDNVLTWIKLSKTCTCNSC